ncbi:OLC1v1006588C1 [Oldenlandia corymbosa var. corymbosa]|uniref:OLC1v1006588C1 n=1 Tax=Oldenlandia corymbosa var. corymbosa TaxID=529605 RepID=A0AAV1DHP4_OLDCO|nr:OLC1v1006588C1 [Oldenlandia corymbosa var. corymbosa]
MFEHGIPPYPLSGSIIVKGVYRKLTGKSSAGFCRNNIPSLCKHTVCEIGDVMIPTAGVSETGYTKIWGCFVDLRKSKCRLNCIWKQHLSYSNLIPRSGWSFSSKQLRKKAEFRRHDANRRLSSSVDHLNTEMVNVIMCLYDTLQFRFNNSRCLIVCTRQEMRLPSRPTRYVQHRKSFINDPTSLRQTLHLGYDPATRTYELLRSQLEGLATSNAS